jgi:shikimate kinase
MNLDQWMGFPYELLFNEHEAKYLACEKEVLIEILRDFEDRNNNSQEDVVVDTTGSVIYTGKETLRKLRRFTMVIYLSTPYGIQRQMLKAYLDKPRPLLWRNIFIKKQDGTNEDTLERCYPKFLSARKRKEFQG